MKEKKHFRTATAPPPLAPVSPQEVLAGLNSMAPSLRTAATTEELSDDFSRRFGAVDDEALFQQALERSDLFALRKHAWVTKEVLLNRARFRIHPTPEEIENGILVPGHRFLPFCHGETAGKTLFLYGRKHRIPFHDMILSYEDACTYHSLLGYTWISGRSELPRPEENTEYYNFKVLDLRAFYRHYHFAQGDFIIAEILDPWTRTVKLRYQSRQAALQKAGLMRATDVALEKAFHHIMEQSHVLWSVPSQLFHALAAAPGFVLKHPGSSFNKFFERIGSLSLQEVGLEKAAFPESTTPFEMALQKSDSDGSGNDLFSDPIDRLFTLLGINLQKNSALGLIRLAVTRDEPFDHFFERLIPWTHLSINQIDSAQELKDYIRLLWTQVIENEPSPPLPPLFVEIFQRSAALKNKISTLLKHLDMLKIDLESLPSHSLLHLMEIDELTDFILESTDGPNENPGKSLELNTLLSELEGHIQTVRDNILKEILA